MVESLAWLDKWEQNMVHGFIRKEEFLTSNTSEGLRMTLNSAIDLTKILLEEFKFNFVLTGRINQDPLEVFLSCHSTLHNIFKKK